MYELQTEKQLKRPKVVAMFGMFGRSKQHNKELKICGFFRL